MTITNSNPAEINPTHNNSLSMRPLCSRHAGRAALFFILFRAAACLNAADVEPGTLPMQWRTGGPNCLEMPRWQVHEYNENFLIIRESGCTHYEKPFLYLIFGSERALLEDTGAGDVDTGRFVMDLVAQWSKRKGRDPIPLLVVHSHAHGDHTAGDPQFKNVPNVEFVASAPADNQKAFGISKWPEGIGLIDLGGRILDVIPIPGHNDASIAIYDRKTGILLTGYSVYPARLYVSDFPAFVQSNQRLVDFTRDLPVAHILGTHIEQTRTPFVDYPRGTAYQPDEHALELSRGTLLELNEALIRLNGKLQTVALRDVTIVPRTPTPAQPPQ